MCGIAGALDLTGSREFSVHRLLAMTGAIAHRGPDDEQIHIEPGVALGRGGSSIVDLAGGRQPIANEDGDDLGRLQRRAVRVPGTPARAAGAGPSPGDAVRHRGVGPPVRGPRRGHVRRGAGPVRRLALGPQQPDADPGPRPGRDLPALLRRARRLAPLGLGGQGAARLGAGRREARSQGDRPSLPLLLRRARSRTLLRGGQVAPAGAFPEGRATAGSTQHQYWDLDFPDAGDRSAGSTTRRRWSTSWRRCSARRSSVGCGATCRSSATSAAGSIRRSSWA